MASLLLGKAGRVSEGSINSAPENRLTRGSMQDTTGTADRSVEQHGARHDYRRNIQDENTARG